MKLSKFLRITLIAGLFSAPLSYAAESLVLHVGDQNYYNIRASIEASGVLKDAPYSVDWKHFQAAAPLAEALQTGSLDLGFLGDSGFLFLAAKQAPVKLIGVSRQNPDTIALLYQLRQAGVDVPLDALSVEECAAAIAQVIRPNTTVK